MIVKYQPLASAATSTDSKLSAALADLRAAEAKVRQAREELAQKAVVAARPKITAADIVPGAKFGGAPHGDDAIVCQVGYANYDEKPKFGLTGLWGKPFAWFSTPAQTAEELAAYLNDRQYVKIPGKWVFEPEKVATKEGDTVWYEGSEERTVVVDRSSGRVSVKGMTGCLIGAWGSLENFNRHLDKSPEEQRLVCAYYSRKRTA